MKFVSKAWPAALAAVVVVQLSGCDESDGGGRAVADIELVSIADGGPAAADVLLGLHAMTLADGVLSIAWDEVADPRVARVEVWRPDMSKWSQLAGGDWNPALDDWGVRVAEIPAGEGKWVDTEALVQDHNRYILRTVTATGEVGDGFVVEAGPAQISEFRAGNWSDTDTHGVGTHDIDGEYINVRNDKLDSVLFMANRGELATISLESRTYNGKKYLEVFFKAGVHAGKRGWVAEEYLRWSVLEVCADTMVRSDADLAKVLGTVKRGTLAYVTSGQVRNTGQNRFFQVSAGGLKGLVATSALCPKGSGAGGSGGGTGGGYDATLAKKLANEAYAGSVGYSMGRCYQYAWNAMKRAIGISEARATQLGIPAASAYQFGDWADANPGALYGDFRLKAIDATAADAPVGSVIVWDRGQCGFSALHGHIEIVASPGYACSDFCGYMYNTCGKPRVYMPVK